MRRALHWLFPIAALTLCLMRPSHAEAPICAGCQITDEQVRLFFMRAQKAIDEANEGRWRAEHKALSCEAFLKDHHA